MNAKRCSHGAVCRFERAPQGRGYSICETVSTENIHGDFAGAGETGEGGDD
jgi:hypothetical protein